MTTKPFYEVIEDLTGFEVIPLTDTNTVSSVIDTLRRVAERVAKDIKLNPIERSRPNEVGNDVKEMVGNVLAVDKSVNTISIDKGAGYPDFKICIDNEIYFLECKIFQSDQINKSMRSFYCSDGPSIRKKINCKAAHILMSFEMKNQENIYTPLYYRLVDLYDLPCRLKKEWNSGNTKLYAEDRVLVKEFV